MTTVQGFKGSKVQGQRIECVQRFNVVEYQNFELLAAITFEHLNG